MMRLRVDQARPGDTILGTWNHAFPTPLVLDAIEFAPEHSQSTAAFALAFTDGTTRVLYGDCLIDLDRPT